MAEIHVEPKRRGRGWLWVVFVLIIAAGIVWYLFYANHSGTTAARSVTGLHYAQFVAPWIRALAS